VRVKGLGKVGRLKAVRYGTQQLPTRSGYGLGDTPPAGVAIRWRRPLRSRMRTTASIAMRTTLPRMTATEGMAAGPLAPEAAPGIAPFVGRGRMLSFDT